MMNEVLNKVMDIREKAWMGESEIFLIHNDGANHQGKMRRVYASLSNGATQYYGTYECEVCGVCVSVRLNSHPDVPYELYNLSISSKNEEKEE